MDAFLTYLIAFSAGFWLGFGAVWAAHAPHRRRMRALDEEWPTQAQIDAIRGEWYSTLSPEQIAHYDAKRREMH